MAADRFNSGKLRYDLIPPRILEILATIYTNGAEKYDPDNWKKGLGFKRVLDSAMRHQEAFRACKDVDDESGLHTLAHAAWNLLTLIEYGKTHPEYDDRDHWWLNPKRVGFDIDGVLAAFGDGFTDRLRKAGHGNAADTFGTHWMTYESDFFDTWATLDNDFWLDLLPLVSGRDFQFQPTCYITQRTVPKKVTVQWLSNNGFPHAKVITTDHDTGKVPAVKKMKLDIFVDDHFPNFQAINTETECVCYLLTKPYNLKYPVGDLRIESLDQLADIVYNGQKPTKISTPRTRICKTKSLR